MVKNARREERGKGIKQVKRKREGKRCVEYREQNGTSEGGSERETDERKEEKKNRRNKLQGKLEEVVLSRKRRVIKVSERI